MTIRQDFLPILGASDMSPFSASVQEKTVLSCTLRVHDHGRDRSLRTMKCQNPRGASLSSMGRIAASPEQL